MSRQVLNKDQLRKELRQARREHVKALPHATRALLFLRPPTPLMELIPDNATIGLYRATEFEAPARSYAKFFYERGHPLALPQFASRDVGMEFAAFSDPFEEGDLEEGPFGLGQPTADAPKCVPQVLIVPLLGFSERGDRLGQGAGHYDRWLAQNPDTVTIALGWDAQCVAELPSDPHDVPMTAIVTPTRMYGPF